MFVTAISNTLMWCLMAPTIFPGSLLLSGFFVASAFSAMFTTPLLHLLHLLSLSAITSFSLAAFALLIAFEQQLEKWNADNSTAKIIICQTVTLEIQTHITAMLVRCGSILSVATVVQVRHSSTACIKPSVISSRGGYC